MVEGLDVVDMFERFRKGTRRNQLFGTKVLCTKRLNKANVTQQRLGNNGQY